jgi:tetratricopeptide (TPR) repeat protein
MMGCKVIFDRPVICQQIVIHRIQRPGLTMKLFFLFICSVLFTACNDNGSSSPYADVLSQQPFSSVTDSIRKEPGRDDLYFRRAVLLNKNNFPEPALADFRKAWSLAKEEVYAVGVSNILLEKKPDSAAAFLNEAIKEIPNSFFLHISLARSYNAMNQTDKALGVCNEILEKEPAQVNTLLLKADLLEKKGDSTGMIAALEKAYHLVPFNREISYKLAYQYAESKNGKAIAIADSLISEDSLNIHAEPYYIKGMFYSNISDKARAIQLFDATINKNHRFLNAYIEKGKVLLDQKKTTDALKTFQLANTITPSFADAWYWIGRCQEILGNKADAKENYEKAFELDNTFTEANEAAEKIK